MDGGKQPKYNGLRSSEHQVMDALEESPGAYEEVFDRVKISRPTYNKALNDLREKGKVEKYYDEQRDKVLYKLSVTAADPVEITNRHFNTIQEGISIDLEEWKKCLSEDALVAHKRIFAFSVGFDYEKKKGIMKEGSIEDIEFNEMVLLKSLARYDLERQKKRSKEMRVKLIEKARARSRERVKVEKEEFKYPAHEIVEELGVEEEFEGIIELLRPLLEGKEFPARRDEFIIPHERNLAALYFKEWKESYGLEWRSYQEVERPSIKERMIAWVQNTYTKEKARKLVEAAEENEEHTLKVLDATQMGDPKPLLEAVREVYPDGPFYKEEKWNEEEEKAFKKWKERRYGKKSRSQKGEERKRKGGE